MVQVGTAEELRVLEEREREGMQLAEALLKVQEGLVNGRKWVWDEAARKLGTVLSSPAAFEGEHFLQVREHVHCSLPPPPFLTAWTLWACVFTYLHRSPGVRQHCLH